MTLKIIVQVKAEVSYLVITVFCSTTVIHRKYHCPMHIVFFRTHTFLNGVSGSSQPAVLLPNPASEAPTPSTSVIRGGRNLEPGEIPVMRSTPYAKTLNSMNKSMLDAAMLQLLATQMMNQQQAMANGQGPAKMNGHCNNKATTKKDPTQLALDLSAKTKAEPGPSSDGTETRSSATPSESVGEVNRKRAPPTESQARVPLSLGWRRQTCIRSIAASGVRGDVVYYAPCGKKLSTYAEVLRYLMKHSCNSICRDNFSFSSKLIVGEFLWPKELENGEKVVVKMSEEAVTEEVNRLLSLKPQPRNGERKHREKPPPILPPEGRTTPVEEPHHEHQVEVEESPLDVYDDEDKVKWSREPIDDLLLTEIRPVPDLPRVENLRLNGIGFADALMICEFVHNFAHVLELDEIFSVLPTRMLVSASSSVPSLSDLCAGLVGDVEHFDTVLQLTLSLFRLSLEYPGLPSGGKRSRTRLGQTVSELGVTEQNYSELMRMFLASRDSHGEKLSHLLVTRSFSELSGEEKAAILAFLCNELLCCPNIVKEIDRNLEEVGRLKGDRWMRDGKARALRVVQRKKQKAERGAMHPIDVDGHSHDDRPSSRNSEASDTSRPVTPIPTTTKDRRLTPGLGQCEILTEEEENMTPDQLEVLIDSLNSEAEHLKEKINELSTKVRSFPLGCDRYHRQYWQIPGVPSVLVESVESSGILNPACNTDDTCSKDPTNLTASSFVHPDVFACVEDLVDDVVTGCSHTERRKRKRFRRMDNAYKRGWWAVDTRIEMYLREALESVRSSLHGRGIRERILHRLLCKSWFLKDVKLGRVDLEKIGDQVDWKTVTEQNRNAVHRQLDELIARITSAKIFIKGTTNGQLRSSSWVEKSLDALKQRILCCERAISRNHLRPSFFIGDKKCLAHTLEMEALARKKDSSHHVDDEDEREEEDASEDQEKDDSDRSEMIERWRSFVESAETSAELSLCIQMLNSSIAWETIPILRLCQICHKRCEDPSTILKCTACRLNYHLGCCKSPQSREWFCPACVEVSTQVPTCLICSRQHDYLNTCRKCYHFFHLDCVGDASVDSHREFICRGCDPKLFERRVIAHGESDDYVEADDVADPTEHHHHGHQNGQHPPHSRESRKPVKRKAEPPPPIVFPTEMNADLCRAMLDELECQPGVGPFLEPVDTDLVPGYRDVIANPIDIASIRNRIEAQCYETPDDFAADMELMFSNCRTFNEDDSPVGIAADNDFYMNKIHIFWKTQFCKWYVIIFGCLP
ncbi:Bromodomain protein [Dictyocaulus viviparus]|uniref:Bromodomain protein n=1 Tax=Dictyocaulus viviparus TaxID=29172 RepID=A0A0D8XUF6_DICVI|nr:Bromodomain protein [Dictyocaulus viviparus]